MSIKRSTLYMKDATCLNVIHILQHPTSHPATGSTHHKMVKAPKKNLSRQLEGRYGKQTKHSTRWHHQRNECKSRLDSERVRVLGALRSMRSKGNLAAETWQELQFLSNNEKGNCMADCMDWVTTVTRNRVENTVTAIKLEPEDMKNAGKTGLTTRKPGTTFRVMLGAIKDSLSDIGTFEDWEDGGDRCEVDDNTEQGKVSEDDKLGWVMVIMSKMVVHQMEHIGQKQMTPDNTMQPGCGDGANFFCERNLKHRRTELMVLPGVQLETEDGATLSAPMTYGEPMKTLGCIPWKSQMQQVTSQPGSAHSRLASLIPWTDISNTTLPPVTGLDLSLIK